MRATPNTQANYEHRRKVKSKSSMCLIVGMMGLCNLPALSAGPVSGHIYWGIVALAVAQMALLAYGLLTYLPIWREEKRDRDAWHRQYQAEADAARKFLFGSAQTRI